jgi:hypothetical protein
MNFGELFAAELIEAVVPILIGIVVAILGMIYQWARFRWEQAKIRLPQWQIMITEQLVRAGVAAAEQKFGPGAGEKKLAYVLNQISAWFQEKGVDIDAERLEMWVEAAVNDLE